MDDCTEAPTGKASDCGACWQPPTLARVQRWVRLRCDSATDGFCRLNSVTRFYQSVTLYHPLDLLIRRRRVVSVLGDAPGQRRLIHNTDGSQSVLVLPLGPCSGLCCRQSAGGEPFAGHHSDRTTGRSVRVVPVRRHRRKESGLLASRRDV